jgi:hypothetical protein
MLRLTFKVEKPTPRKGLVTIAQGSPRESGLTEEGGFCRGSSG